MSHQTGQFWDRATDDFVDKPLDDFPIESTRIFYNHYGAEFRVGEVPDRAQRTGTITIRDFNGQRDANGEWLTDTILGSLGGSYLECSGIRKNRGPFFSIVAEEDQWGTWYSMRLGEGEPVVFPQAWGGSADSFIYQLGQALMEFAEKNEPLKRNDALIAEAKAQKESE